jgi:hypothetical protein
MIMITEECHPEEVQAFATRRPADEGPAHCSLRARPDCRVHFTHEDAPSKLAWAGSPSAERIRDFPTLTSKSTTLEWATRPPLAKNRKGRGTRQDVEIIVKPTRKPHGEVSVVA